jgi:large subunit ribosomal protein L21
MYAVIENGGKQYRVAPGETVQLETVTGEVGAQVEFSRVLLVVVDGQVRTGAAAARAVVKGTITEHDREAKTIVFKFKRKKQYRRTIGHRQNYTRVQIDEIVA